MYTVNPDDIKFDSFCDVDNGKSFVVVFYENCVRYSSEQHITLTARASGTWDG